jgi:PAS domain S-box-containing protein
MELLPFIRCFAFLMDVGLMVFILSQRPKSKLNMVCAAFIGCFAIWSFMMIFTQNSNASKQIAMLLVNFTSFGWCSFPVFFLWLVLIFTGKEKQLKPKAIYASIFILPLIFIYKQWTNSFVILYPIKQSYGWTYIWVESIWTYLFYIYYTLFMCIPLYMLLKIWKKEVEQVKRKQAQIIFSATLISLVLASFTNVVCPNLNIHRIPLVGDVIALIWMGGVVYAIRRYKFLTITPYTAASNIISTMADALMLIDQNYHIVNVNNALLQLLAYKENEIVGQPFETLLADQFEKRQWLDRMISESSLKNYDLFLKNKSGGNIPISLSSSMIKDDTGGVVGFVCIARDMTERKQAEEQREKLIEELQTALGNVKTLRGLVPICSNCKKVRNDQGYWQQVEEYVREHTEADFTHGLCEECAKKLYPDHFEKAKNSYKP